ncbi:hypothetical protein C8F04DRAFT_398647 [Mycena alexandri]|uniref:Uncharacterized protein n=1 Tax=Mycena alexandri TaxID=1745969 RepID=A0AAD6WRE6_9AGAR|nr:hypothetical protein C8F04DRAFT_398647 [Mycena alexandri]
MLHRAVRTLGVGVPPDGVTVRALAARQTFFSAMTIYNDNFDLNNDTAPSILGLSILQFGASLGGLALIVAGILIWLCYRSKARVRDHEANIMLFNQNYAMPTAPPPVPTLTRPQRSFSMLKREQTAAIPRYEDRYTAPDVLVRTVDGLQLLPGSLPAKNKKKPFWRQSNISSNFK